MFRSSSKCCAAAAAAAFAAFLLVLVPDATAVESVGAYVDGAEAWTASDCAGDVPIVVGSDMTAQSDIYSAITLAGAVATDCVVLAGARGGDMSVAQKRRLDAANAGGYVVGGVAAVPAAKTAGRDMKRIGGADRWVTAQQVGAIAAGVDPSDVPNPPSQLGSVRSAGAHIKGGEGWFASDCAGDVPIVVGSDTAAQSDIYSAITLAGAIGTDCVILAGARSGDMSAAQRARLGAANVGGYVVGGFAAVSGAKVTGREMERIAGVDRWFTAQLVGQRAAQRIGVGELDLDKPCSSFAPPDTTERYVEILKFADGCMWFEYELLGDRTLEQVRETYRDDVSVVAIDFPAVAVPNQTAGSRVGDPWHFERVNADRLQAGWPAGAQVKIAVLDSGVDRTHPDLAHTLIDFVPGTLREITGSSGRFSSLRDFWNKMTAPGDVEGDSRYGHGTNTAGIIAARWAGSPAKGIAPSASILPISVWGKYWLPLAEAVRIAIYNDVDVINFSGAVIGSMPDTLQEMLERAHEEGILFVTTANNCGTWPVWYNIDSCYERDAISLLSGTIHRESGTRLVVTVGASAQNNRRASLSSMGTAEDRAAGRRVEIAAPGLNGITTHPGGRTKYNFGGTSMAAPIVSAVLAHLIARFPDADSTLIRSALLETAENPDGSLYTNGLGYGIVRPLEAIAWLERYFSGDADSQTSDQNQSDNSPDSEQGTGGSGNPSSAVVLSVGNSSGQKHDCSSAACRYLDIEVDTNILGRGPYDVVCYNGNEPWFSGRVARAKLSSYCYFGFPGRIVYVTVDGHRSNSVRWPSPDAQSPALETLGARYTAVTAGTYHSCGLRTDGTAVCWGSNEYGQATAPNGTFASLTAGTRHVCGLRPNGTAVCWGYNENGQTVAPEGRFTSITAGEFLTCGTRTDGSAVCWGGDFQGQTVIAKLDMPDGTYAAISAGVGHSCGLRPNGRAFCWGDNHGGQASAPGGTYRAVSAGGLFSCGLHTNGTASCWGYEEYVDVPPGSYVAISAGTWHGCGIRTNGDAVCWGWNGDGQTDVPAGKYKAISAGREHSCGIRTNGTVVCWGRSEYTDTPTR